jgi:hypothetical protein
MSPVGQAHGPLEREPIWRCRGPALPASSTTAGKRRLPLAVGPALIRPALIRPALIRPALIRPSVIGPAVVGLALALAACGGGSPRAGVASVGTTTTMPVQAGAPATASSSSKSAGLVEYARCMHSHGVLGFPGPGSAPGAAAAFKQSGALSSPRFEDARRACSKYAPRPAPPPAVSPQQMQKLLAVSRCMRSHGVADFPDPNPTTGNIDPPPGISENSPIVIAALRACYPLAHAAGLGPPNTGH